VVRFWAVERVITDLLFSLLSPNVYVSADILLNWGELRPSAARGCSVQYSILILSYLIICLILDCYLISFIRYCNSVRLLIRPRVPGPRRVVL